MIRVSTLKITAVLVLSVTLGVGWLTWRKELPTHLKELRDSPTASERLPEVNSIRTGERRQSTPSRKRQHLEDLIGRWNRSGSVGDRYVSSHERQALVREAVTVLLCSPELVEFIQLLKDQGFPGYNDLINNTVAELLRSKDSGKVRASLISLEETHGDKYAEFFQPWFVAVGKSSSEEDVVEFCSKLKSDNSKLDALSSFYVELAKTEPSKAVTSTLEEYAKRSSSPSGSITVNLQEQISSLAPNENYGYIEKMIPLPTGENKWRDESLVTVRRALFQKWAETDPASAANYIMAHPQLLSADYVRAVAETVCRQNTNVAMEWAQSFPEGTYYDAAVSSIIFRVEDKYPEQAMQLAERIENKALREEYIAELVRLSKIPAENRHGE